MIDFFISAAHAMGPTPGQQGASQPSLLANIIPIVLIIAIFYIIVFLPEKKRKKTHEQMLNNLKSGDKIITTSGIYGEISKVENDHYMLKISDNNTKIKIMKTAVSIVLDPLKEKEAVKPT